MIYKENTKFGTVEIHYDVLCEYASDPTIEIECAFIVVADDNFADDVEITDLFAVGLSKDLEEALFEHHQNEVTG